MKFTAKHVMLILMSVLLVLVAVMGVIVLNRVADFLQVSGDPSVNTPPSSSTPGTVGSSGGSSITSRPEDSIPSHEHNFSEGKTFKPTCISSGYTLYACECGKEDIRDFTDPLGHTYGEKTVIEATCTTDGWTERTCSRCSNVERTELVSASHTGDWADIPEEDSPSTQQQRICEICNTTEIRSLDTDKKWVICLTPMQTDNEYLHYQIKVDTADTDNGFNTDFYTNVIDGAFRFDYDASGLFITYFVNGEQKQYTVAQGTAVATFHADGTVTHEEPITEENPNPDTPPDSEVDPENPSDTGETLPE